MKNAFPKQSVTSEAAHQVMAAAERKALEIGTPMVIAVVDESGVLKALSRMDCRAVERSDRAGQGVYGCRIRPVD